VGTVTETPSLSGLLVSGRAGYMGGGSGSSSSTSGITGVESLGAGSALASGILESDLRLKSLVGGTNVTLSSDDSTITIDAAGAGGGGSGEGIGSNSFVSGNSNFYKTLPDSLVHIANDRVYNLVFEFIDTGSSYTATAVRYKDSQTAGGNDRVLSFRNDSGGTNAATSLGGDGSFNSDGPNFTTLSGYVASGRAVYLGGGSDSSSSTTGITGASNIGAGSAIVSGISSNDLKVKSLVGGTNVTLSSDDSTITIDAAGGGGAGGDGPGNSTYYTGFSNFYTELPDWIAVKGTDSNPIYIAYLSSIDGSSTFRYSHTVDGATTRYTYNFNNNTSGSFHSEDWVGTVTETPSLSGLLVSGRAGYMGGGSGSSSSTSGSTSGINNEVINEQYSVFSGTLPNSVLVSGVGGSATSVYTPSFVGRAAAYLMYGVQVNASVNARIDFNHNESGTLNSVANCSTPYASLQEMINSGYAIYY
jgi:hypothetical protein